MLYQCSRGGGGGGGGGCCTTRLMLYIYTRADSQTDAWSSEWGPLIGPDPSRYCALIS